MCEMSVLEGLWGKNTDKEGVAGGRVNAQAFSFVHESGLNKKPGWQESGLNNSLIRSQAGKGNYYTQR